MVKVKVLHVRFVIPQEITFKSFYVARSHYALIPEENSLKYLTKVRLIRLRIISTIRASKNGTHRIRQLCRRVFLIEYLSVSISAKRKCFDSRNLISCLLLLL